MVVECGEQRRAMGRPSQGMHGANADFGGTMRGWTDGHDGGGGGVVVSSVCLLTLTIDCPPQYLAVII